MAPAVTVLMPVYQAASTVEAAIASVLTQTDPDFELLVADDGSTDHPTFPPDPRIRVLRLPHRGIVSALNAGLAEARGHYIARMDADDLMRPRRLELQRARLDQDPGLGLVSCLVAHPSSNGTEGYARYVDWLNATQDIALNRFIEAPIAHPSVMFRRELINQHGGYQEGEFPEDYELWLRWLEAGVKMEKIPEILLDWHDLPGRLSRTDPRYGVDAFYRLKAGYLARWLRSHGHREILIWGSGKTSRQRAAHLQAAGIRITAYIDVDPRRKLSRDVPIHHYLDVRSPTQGFIVSYVGKRGARDFVRAHLASHGFVEGQDFLVAA